MIKKQTLGIFTAIIFSVFVGSNSFAETALKFTELDHFKSFGQIHGYAESCSDKHGLNGTIVHIPGVSVSTRLGHSGEFLLLSVPKGEYNLTFERGDQVQGRLQKITVQPRQRTEVGTVQLCPDMDGDGFNILSDINDNNPRVHPGAKELCDRIDNNGNGEVDEGCSYRKCPKGGKFCLNNWNNSNRWYRGPSSSLDKETQERELTMLRNDRKRLSTQVR